MNPVTNKRLKTFNSSTFVISKYEWFSVKYTFPGYPYPESRSQNKTAVALSQKKLQFVGLTVWNTCSETTLTGESRFHISTPLGIWAWVPWGGKQTGSPLDQWDMVRMKWDCWLSTYQRIIGQDGVTPVIRFCQYFYASFLYMGEPKRKWCSVL
jgi:hypothetical protein